MADQNETTPPPEPLDAVLLCGAGRASHQVEGERAKALLTLEGRPLFIHAIKALLASRLVAKIFVVGPKERLDRALSEWGEGDPRRVVTVEQKENLMTNIWTGFLASLDGYRLGMENENETIRKKAALFLAGDTPLLTPGEIGEMIGEADLLSHDYVVGLTPGAALEKFTPREGKPGIQQALFHARDGLFRINNLHIARPFLIRNRSAIQKMYNARYQKNPLQFLTLLKDLWQFRPIRARLWVFLFMHAAMRARRYGFPRLSDVFRQRVGVRDVVESVGTILGVRAGWAVTSAGGAALDIDNDEDYHTMQTMAPAWRQLLEREEGPAVA